MEKLATRFWLYLPCLLYSGDNHPYLCQLKLTRDQQKELIASINAGELISAIGDRYGIHASTVAHYRAKWTSVKPPPPGRQPKLSAADIVTAQDMRKGGFTLARIAQELGVSRQRVHQLLKA